ncbi:MAG: hypothetical protein QOE06_3483 [Thermoleophilaceae bacterium]|nr:hypothetical protein [Thermoleophilaceae bacterium]
MGSRLETSLLVPTGFALLIAVTTLTASSGWSAGLGLPAVLVLAVAGLALGARRHDRRFSRLGAAAVLGVFAVGAAPVVLSGQAGFAGYTQLDDISTFLALATHVAEHGRSVDLAASTAEAAIKTNLGVGYPVGSFVPLAVTRPLVGQDSAWLWQPYLTFMLAVLASSLWALAAPLVRDLRLRAVAVFIAGQPALLYAYALQGGVKELAAAAMAALAAAVAAAIVREPERIRLALPLAVALMALVGVLGVGAAPYIGALAAGAVALALLWHARDRPALGQLVHAGAITVAVTSLLALPVIAIAAANAPQTSGLLQNKTDIGNLFQALDWKQIFGIWPIGEFRVRVVDHRGLMMILIWVLAAAAVAGVVIALRRRAGGPPLFAACAVGAAIGISTFGNSPWLDAKALAIGSPAVVLLGVVGACLLLESRAQVLGAVALAAIGAGVLWSNWLIYRDANIAPRARLAELATIGERFRGQGPMLINEYEPYGARYFLRKADPESPSELRRRVVPLRRGTGLDKLEWAPVDEFQPVATLEYRTIVLRRSPAESRPLPGYTLRFGGRYYDVWERPPQPTTRVIEQTMFGDRVNAVGPAPCAEVRRLAGVARRNGARLVAAERPAPVIGDLAAASRPPEWTFTPGRPARLFPTGAGTARLPVQIGAAGEYDVWMLGSFGRGIELSVDGHSVRLVRNELSFEGVWIRFGSVRLAPGAHEVAIRADGGSLRPGGTEQSRLGPVALVPRTPAPALVDLAPAKAASVCGKPLDWLAVVAR